MAVDLIAYLMCELKSRDFESRLLIASHLLAKRCAVVVGQRWAIEFNRGRIPHGCYLFPTGNGIQARSMAEVAAAGHAVVAADEEALALNGEAMITALSPGSTTHDLFLANSEEHRAVVAARFPAAKLRTVGNARLDLIRRESGNSPSPNERYILFNTNFPLTNSLWGDRQAAAEPLINAGLTDIDERFAFEDARKAALTPVMAWAIESLDMNIVIRPHPGETAAPWHALGGGRNNVRVIVGESPAKWIGAADLVVHSDCTTGLEAAVMNRRTLNVSPHAWGAKYVMRDVNFTVDSVAAAIAALKDFRKTGFLPPPRRSASEMFPSQGAQQTATAIIDVLRTRGARQMPGGLGWESIVRPAMTKKKFTATRAELLANRDVGASGAQVHDLDESVFLLTPKKPR